MIKLETNSSRFKWYRSGLPKYTVIDSGIKLSNFIMPKTYGDDVSKDVADYLNSLSYLTNISYSIADNDLFTTPARVFIDEETKIYIGRVDWAVDISEIWDSIMFLIICELAEIVRHINNEIDHQLKYINRSKFNYKLVKFDIDLVEDKPLEFLFKSNRIIDLDRGKGLDASFKRVVAVNSHRLRYYAGINAYKQYSKFIEDNEVEFN